MARIVLGLDIGGANLKAATSAGRAKSVPFAVWKHPEKLTAELAKLITEFPEASEVAATMTAELCDCYETKREGVRRIVQDLQKATKLPIRIWSTDGEFVTPNASLQEYLKVAAANWHAMATVAARFVPNGNGLLIDIGTTTTDIVPLKDGIPNHAASTDAERLLASELIYMGWRRTPATSFLGFDYSTELFATTLDAYLTLGLVREESSNTDTADGRPATIGCAKARLAKMLCGDIETIDEGMITKLATDIMETQIEILRSKIALHLLDNLQWDPLTQPMTAVITGSGQFLSTHYFATTAQDHWNIIVLDEALGVTVASPAYAVALLAAERA